MFGNPLLEDGDTVIMDNCRFHHARHVKLVLRNMHAIRGVSLIYQPPYHPQFNTCKLCFRHLHSPIQILQFPIVLVQLLLEYPKISSNFTAISTSNSEKSWQFSNMLVGKCKKCFCYELLSFLFYNKGRNCLSLLCLAVLTKKGSLIVILSFLWVCKLSWDRTKQAVSLFCCYVTFRNSQ